MAVDPGQAGESLPCDCGAAVAVPTLRQLRQLPMARDEAGATTRAVAPAWGLQQGAITVILMLAATCLVLAGVSRYAERPVPQFDPLVQTQYVDRQVENLSPLGAWQVWLDSYQSLATQGFEVITHPNAEAMQQDLDWHRWMQKLLLAAAAVFGVAAAVIGIMGRGRTSR